MNCLIILCLLGVVTAEYEPEYFEGRLVLKNHGHPYLIVDVERSEFVFNNLSIFNAMEQIKVRADERVLSNLVSTNSSRLSNYFMNVTKINTSAEHIVVPFKYLYPANIIITDRLRIYVTPPPRDLGDVMALINFVPCYNDHRLTLNVPDGQPGANETYPHLRWRKIHCKD